MHEELYRDIGALAPDGISLEWDEEYTGRQEVPDDELLFRVLAEVCSPHEANLVQLYYYKDLSLSMSSAIVGRSHYSHTAIALKKLLVRLHRYFEYRRHRGFIYNYIRRLLQERTERITSGFSVAVMVVFMVFMGYSQELVRERFSLGEKQFTQILRRAADRLESKPPGFLGGEVVTVLRKEIEYMGELKP